MKLRSISARESKTQVRDRDSVLDLVYEKWYSQRATAQVEGFRIEIRPEGFWGTKFGIFRNGQRKGEIRMGWLETIIIELEDHHGFTGEWKLCSKGFWKQRFELVDPSGKVFFTLTPKMNWRSWRYDYEIELADQALNQTELLEMLAYAGHGANTYLTMMMGAAAAG